MNQDPRVVDARLREVLGQLEKRTGTSHPGDQAAVEGARRILINSGNRGSIGIHSCPATIFYVKDSGQEYTVHVFAVARSIVLGGGCSCQPRSSKSLCPHLLAVLADNNWHLDQ